jgi:hypothetical protein
VAPDPLSFTEPNLSFAAVPDGVRVLRVELDLEFRTPSHRTHREAYSARNVLDLVVTSAQLRRAAEEWESDVERFPDRGI